VKHARQLHIDAEQRLAGDDGMVVDAADARAEQAVVLGVLELPAILGFQLLQ